MSPPNERAFVQMLTGHLDSGLAAIPQEHLQRLARARETALARQKSPTLLTRVGEVALALHLDFFAQRALARFAALLVVSAALAFWHAQSYVVELEELDSAILTDEMPMDVITDKGFNEWLQASAER
jgi:hypothetical protein